VTEPHRLVNAGRRWYLLAWDVDRRDWRTFRVDRVRLRSPAGPRFAPREMDDDEVTERVARGLARATWQHRARVTVHATAGELAARLPDGFTVEAIDDETCTVEVGSDSPAMLAVYLGMLGVDFTVDPATAPELADHLRVLGDRYARAVG
jgi:predicted DNA-binding transcriptional regulator YafY